MSEDYATPQKRKNKKEKKKQKKKFPYKSGGKRRTQFKSKN